MAIQVIDRAVRILRVVARRGPSSLTEISAESRLPVPTAARILQSLVDNGILRRLDDKTYHLLRCDAAGPGEFRGGSGAAYHVIVEAEAEYAFRGEGQRTPSGYGVHGGGMGAAGNVEFHAGSAPWTPPQFGTGRVGPTEIKIHSPAGGGWGDPKKRAADLVLLDVRNGIVSAQAARAVYGVAIAADGRSVDIAATRALRGE